MNRGVGQKIGATMGEVLDVDVAGVGAGWGSSLRIQVNIDVTKPLERGCALRLEGRSVWVTFKYESYLCFVLIVAISSTDLWVVPIPVGEVQAQTRPSMGGVVTS
ncbi:hypothetical protein SLA2020_263370 [Shorea laevis]